jgi:hypothetical protein
MPRPFFDYPTTDTTQVGRVYRFVANCYINMFFDGLFDGADVSSSVKMASALNLKLMTPGLVVPRPGDVTDDAVWAAFVGYRFDDGNEHIPPPTPTLRAGAAAIHAADPTKLIYANETDTATIAAWMKGVPEERPDVWSRELYVPNTLASTTLDDKYLGAVGPDPLWSFAYVANDYGFSEPSVEALRAMAFLPIAYGARGIVWSDWESEFGELYANSGSYAHGASIMGLIPTDQYWRIRTINHYLHDVVGPAVMRCDYKWTLHHQAPAAASATPPTAAGVPSDPKYYPPGVDPTHQTLFLEARDIPGQYTMVSIWQPRTTSATDPAGTWYLLVGNRSLGTISDDLTLHGSTYYAVGAAPSVIDYAGGSYFANAGANHSPAGTDHLSTFHVSLEGGEARLYKVVPQGAEIKLPADIAGLTLTSEIGDTPWHPGESHFITLDTPLSDINARLYTDKPACEGASPSVMLPTAVTSGTFFAVVAPTASSRHAWVEVTGYTPDGCFVHLTHQVPLKLSVFSQLSYSTVLTTPTYGHAYAAEARLPDGNPAVALTTGLNDPQANLWVPTAGSSPATIPDYLLSGRVPGTLPGPVGQFGLSPSVFVDPSGMASIAYFTLYWDLPLNLPPVSQYLRYAHQEPSGWAIETIDYVGRMQPECALVLNGAGVPYVLYNSGSAGNYATHLVYRAANGTWPPFLLRHPIGPAHDFSIKRDASGVIWVCGITNATGQLVVESTNGDVMLGSTDCLTAAMHIADDGVPEVAYATLDPGFDVDNTDVYFQRVQWNATHTVLGTTPEVVDASFKEVAGLALATYQGATEVAVACNGAVRIDHRYGANSWSAYELAEPHTATGQLGFSTTAAGGRWFTYWDRPTDRMIASFVPPPPPPPEPGDGDDGGGERLPPAITFRSQNPVQVRGELVFRLSLPHSSRVSMRLYDIGGRLAAERPEAKEGAGVVNIAWRPKGIRPGVYFLEVRGASGSPYRRRVTFVD